MKIFIVTPSVHVPHGGIRVILEWANHLTKWHDVYLYSQNNIQCDWFPISEKVNRVFSESMTEMDCLIMTSPHNADWQYRPDVPKKKFMFIQMCEHFFKPNDPVWVNKCFEMYRSKCPIISISGWNIQEFIKHGNDGIIHYVQNGINLNHFPLKRSKKEPKTILVEGWESTNPSKDSAMIGPQAAAMLKDAGYKIIAYSQVPLKTFSTVPDEYYFRPDLATMNNLYERAIILIKATQCDARSCAPMEAMAKGTPTVRAINYGDDDLINDVNCIKIPYHEAVQLFDAVINLLKSPDKLDRLSEACLTYASLHDWNFIMPEINEILCKD